MDSKYLERASIEKIVVYDKTNLWEFIINNDKILPVYIYDELCNKLKNTFKSIDNITLTINTADNDTEFLEDYFDTLINNLINESVKYKSFEGRDLKIEDGKYIKNPSVAMELLPTTSGFFFGGTDYDEYYVNDIKETIDIVTKVLETTDFEKEMVYYVSSW